jgi:hypothetical protein
MALADQAVAVVAQGVAHEAQLDWRCCPCGTGAHRHRCSMRACRCCALAFEVGASSSSLPSFAHKALVARPGLDEGAVHAEVLAREPVVLVGNGQHLVEQFDDRVVRNQAFTVLGEDRGHPDGIVHGQADEPAKQQVVLGSAP